MWIRLSGFAMDAILCTGEKLLLRSRFRFILWISFQSTFGCDRWKTHSLCTMMGNDETSVISIENRGAVVV